MKIGIVTLYGTFNYGNRLQNYALHTVLSEMGHDVATLVSLEKVSYAKVLFRKYFEREAGSIRLKTKKEFHRDSEFKRFTEENIPTKFFSSKRSGLSKALNEEYDCFVVGSDQVWNPLWWGDSLECGYANDYLLQFADGQKRLAYSASFGLDSIPGAWSSVFERELGKFRSISIREEAGATIVKKLIGREVPVTLDPTMLLDAGRWRLVEKDIVHKGKYVFQFNLGERSDAQMRLEAELRELGYEVIDYMNPKCPYFGGDPFEFLSLLDGADCVLTDSFHASVFSIIFHRPFAVFDRKHANGSNMNSRINTLLEACNLSDRWNICHIEKMFSYDTGCIDAVLDKRRNESMEYLRAALLSTRSNIGLD